MPDVTLLHFKVWSKFKPDSSLYAEGWGDGTPQYLVDQDTGDKYLNEDTGLIRFKCFLLILGSPLVHTIAALFHTTLKLLNLFDDILVSIYALWMNQKFSTCLLQDFFLLILSPTAPVILTFAALYGVFFPHNGRKFYASIERLLYGGFLLAPCFQPEPEEHLFGGNILEKNAW